MFKKYNAIIFVILGIILGVGAVKAWLVLSKPTDAAVEQEAREIVLGHRIGPHGQEMLVYK